MYNNRLTRLEDNIDRYDPDVIFMKDTRDYKDYRKRLYKEPDKRYTLNISRSMMYYLNCCEKDIYDKHSTINEMRKRLEKIFLTKEKV